jgi:hypothetical protein
MLSLFDITNGFFEIVGSIAVWANVRQIVKDKRSAGISPLAMGFFTIWAFWNLIYYYHLSQWFSMLAAVPLAIGDLIWVGLMIKFRKFSGS